MYGANGPRDWAVWRLTDTRKNHNFSVSQMLLSAASTAFMVSRNGELIALLYTLLGRASSYRRGFTKSCQYHRHNHYHHRHHIILLSLGPHHEQNIYGEGKPKDTFPPVCCCSFNEGPSVSGSLSLSQDYGC